ncbi:MAG TPA: RDD family protein [Bdellovibrionota bacterium]|jgi:uncharacterized RDD family membrane protein YckC
MTTTDMTQNSEFVTSLYASYSRRLGAAFLDCLILLIPACIMGSVIPVIGGIVAYFLYAPFLESSVLRATIGKKLMGIQVNAVDGGRISFRSAMIRALMKLISSALFFVPHLLALFTEKRQALHDLVAETVVVYGRVEMPVVDAWMDTMREVFRSEKLNPTKGHKLSDLERLQSLYERGALSKEEFEEEKKKVLGRV